MSHRNFTLFFTHGNVLTMAIVSDQQESENRNFRVGKSSEHAAGTHASRKNIFVGAYMIILAYITSHMHRS